MAFTSPKRIEILDLLKDGDMTVTEIQNNTGMEKAHTSLMLNFMRVKNVLKRERPARMSTTASLTTGSPMPALSCRMLLPG